MGKTIWGSGTHRFCHFWAQSFLFTVIPPYSEGITWYYAYYICQNIDSWNISESEAWTTTKPSIPIAAVVLARGWRMWRVKQLSSCPVHQTFFISSAVAILFLHCQFMESLWKSIIQLPIEFCWRGWDDHHLSDVFMCFHVLVLVKTLLGAKPLNISLLKPFFCRSHYHLHRIFYHFQSLTEKHMKTPIKSNQQ